MPDNWSDNGTQRSTLGGVPGSWQQITSEQHPCLVASICVQESPQVTPTPEPSAIALVALGMAALVLVHRRARRMC